MAPTSLSPSQSVDDSWITHLTTLLGTPSTTGNELRILRNGTQIFDAMLDAIEHADHSVDLVTFVYWSGDVASRFASALSDAASRGCRVRVLLDAFGARRTNNDVLVEMLDAGCEVRWFRSLFDGFVPQFHKINHRTHRKILVCDRSVGFTGGVGIADEWDGAARGPGEWRDTHVQVRGPAVSGLQAGFLDNWSDARHDEFDPMGEPAVDLSAVGSSTCTVVRGSAEAGASELWRLLLALVVRSTRSLNLTSAYFNPDEPMVAALCKAAGRGVNVRVLLPGEHADKRFVQLAGESDYRRLLDAGVGVWNYQTSMLHAKVITVDGVVATVGSANFNSRSMNHDEETNLVIFDKDIVAELDDHFAHDLTSSTELDPARWPDRNIAQRAAETVAAMADRWL